MRIAVVWHRLGPYHLARLRAAGKVAEIVAIEMSGADNTYAWDKVESTEGFQRVTVYPDCDCNTMPRSDIQRRLFAALDACKPDVVAISGYSESFALAALLWCVRRKIPSVVMSPSNAFDHPRGAWREWVKRRLIRQFQAGLAGGNEAQNYLAHLGLRMDRILLGYDAIDNDYFSGWQAPPGSTAKISLPAHYFIAVARFLDIKNLGFLIDAYAQYRQRTKANPWSLLILGDGATRPQLEDQRRRMQLEDHVLLPGFVQYPELPRYYQRADALILPSLREPWGLVVNEAMACGLPVLVSNRCGCATTLVEPGKNGFIFDPENLDELTGMMCRLAGGDLDLKAMGQASHEIVDRWSPATFANNLLSAAKIACRETLPGASLLDQAMLRLLIRFR